MSKKIIRSSNFGQPEKATARGAQAAKLNWKESLKMGVGWQAVESWNNPLQASRSQFAWLIALSFISLCFSESVFARVITAKVVALDQVYTYNRFGAFNPYGMMYALRRDVVDNAGNPIGSGGALCNVKLRSTKRPRPLVLRGNVGDVIKIEFTNLLCLGASGVGADKPATRKASLLPNGLTVLSDGGS